MISKLVKKCIYHEKNHQILGKDFLEINQFKLLIIVDSFSKWIECFAMGSTTATKVIEVL
jgi:hypothetical protein